MRLTQWTDYTLRVLMYCAACQGRAEPVTITEIAEQHGISRSHLTKIVQELGARGWLETMRGRGGGIRLLKSAQEIVLGDVVRPPEPDFAMVARSAPQQKQFRMSQPRARTVALPEATQSYLSLLDSVTLADLVASPVPGATSPAANTRRLQPIPGLPFKGM